MTRNPHAAQRHLSFRLERWHRLSVYLTGVVLLLSGAAWIVLRYFLRPVGEFGETVNPLEPWAMKLHGAAAMAALFFVGSVLHLHVRRALKARRNLAMGWAVVGMLLFLVLTGYALYYVAGDADRPTWSLLHWAAGFLAAFVFAAHIVMGRKRVT